MAMLKFVVEVDDTMLLKNKTVDDIRVLIEMAIEDSEDFKDIYVEVK